jgi:MoaA/NifB/PqqE/SkfB family radical SAM enzyme
MTVRFNTVIKDDNLDQIMPIVRHAKSIGAGANVSVYTDFKNGNPDHLIRDEQRIAVDGVIKELLAFKRANRGVISNSDWYLEQLPRYLRGEMTEKCRSGETTIHIGHTGLVRRCPDFPSDHHWKDHTPYTPIACNRCYYACRGEAQAPLTISRFQDLIA